MPASLGKRIVSRIRHTGLELALPYFAIRSLPAVHSYLDRKGALLHEAIPPTLSAEAKRVALDLARDGIAITTVEKLLGPAIRVEDLVSYAKALDSEGEIGHKKAFLKYLWQRGFTLPFESPFIAAALSQPALDIVRTYLSCAPKLRFVSLNVTIPIPPDSPATGSQRWHRDPGIERNCKIFIYASDVDEGAGPFTYIRGSHMSARWGRLFPRERFGRGGSYPPADEVAKHIPAEEMLSCTGPRGTIIFCDTLGLHRGGYATDKERVMFTAHFERPSGFDPRWYALPEATPALSPLAAFAVSE